MRRGRCLDIVLHLKDLEKIIKSEEKETLSDLYREIPSEFSEEVIERRGRNKGVRTQGRNAGKREVRNRIIKYDTLSKEKKVRAVQKLSDVVREVINLLTENK